MESLTWRSPLQLATYRDRQRGVQMQFHYAQGRLPQAVTVQDQGGTTTYLLGYDQVGSLKAVAAMEGGAACATASPAWCADDSRPRQKKGRPGGRPFCILAWG